MFGRSKQFKLFLQEKWQELYKVAYAWSHDHALSADLVQETITRCLRSSDKFTNEEELRIWLFKVLRNCWRDDLRRRKPNVDIHDTDLQTDHDLESQHHIRQVMSHVTDAFQKMTIEHREILSLIVIEGFSYEAAANILDIPTGTVMSRVSRARNNLREQLKDIDFPDSVSTTLWRVK